MTEQISRRDFLHQTAKTVLATALAYSGLEALADESKQNLSKKRKYQTSDPTFSEDSDEVLLARMLFGEARSCSDLEKVAIGYTAVNRVNDSAKRFGRSLKEVILAKGQYSCFNKSKENKKNRAKLMNPESYESEVFRNCLSIAQGLLKRNYKDPAGANHYHEANIEQPSWANKMKRIGQIEIGKTRDGKPILSRHVFYRG